MAIRAERFELMARLAQLPQDTVFFTQITMEAAEDPDFLSAMKAAHILGALVGVEAVTPEGLKDVYKDFNCAGEHLVKRLRTFRQYGIHVLGSFIFGLPSDRAQTFAATAKVAEQAELTFAQFRDADSLSGDGGLRALGKNHAERYTTDRGYSAYSALAYSIPTPAQNIRSPSGNVRPRIAAAHSGRMG